MQGRCKLFLVYGRMQLLDDLEPHEHHFTLWRSCQTSAGCCSLHHSLCSLFIRARLGYNGRFLICVGFRAKESTWRLVSRRYSHLAYVNSNKESEAKASSFNARQTSHCSHGSGSKKLSKIIFVFYNVFEYYDGRPGKKKKDLIPICVGFRAHRIFQSLPWFQPAAV